MRPIPGLADTPTRTGSSYRAEAVSWRWTPDSWCITPRTIRILVRLFFRRAGRPDGKLGHVAQRDLRLGCGLEYSSGSGRHCPGGWLKPVSCRGVDLLEETAEFNRVARALLSASVPPDLTLAAMLAEAGLAVGVLRPSRRPAAGLHHLVRDTATAGRYPVGALLAFLDNHGLLMSGDATRWRTVTGASCGSMSYVSPRH